MPAQKSKMEAMQTNKANKVAINAEIRRIRVRFAEKGAKFQKLATKKEKRIPRDELVRTIRLVAGDMLLTAIIKSFRAN